MLRSLMMLSSTRLWWKPRARSDVIRRVQMTTARDAERGMLGYLCQAIFLPTTETNNAGRKVIKATVLESNSF